MKVQREVLKYQKVDMPFSIDYVLTVRTIHTPNWLESLLGKKTKVIVEDYIGNVLWSVAETGKAASFELEYWLEAQLNAHLSKRNYDAFKKSQEPSWKIGNRKILENLPDLGWKNESL